MLWAAEFGEIPATLVERDDLRVAMRRLLVEHEIPVKITEGGDRRERRKLILEALFAGVISLEDAVARAEMALARDDSPHRTSNLVFAKGWAKRLIHTHYSVFYCWAVLDALIADGQTRCYVPHSEAESETSACSRLLAGQSHASTVMRERLIQSYVAKQQSRAPLVPNHPHCTHVVAPVPSHS